jgi:hypothetical protein
MNINLMHLQIILASFSLGLQNTHSTNHINYPRISFNISARSSISENNFQETPKEISYEIKHGLPFPKYSSHGTYFLLLKSAEYLRKSYSANN